MPLSLISGGASLNALSTLMRLSERVGSAVGILSKVSWKAYRLFASLLRDRRFLNYQVGGRSVRGLLTNISWRLLHRTIPNPMLVYDDKIYHHAQPASAVAMASECYEPETTRLLLNFLKARQTFIDVGAHIGYFTLLAARAVEPTGRVYAFEPAPANRDLLLRNIRVNGYNAIVTVVPKVVCDRSGAVSLFLSKEDSGSNSILPSPLVGTDSVSVEATTLDEFFEGEGWPPVHLIKMDIEGAEKAALKGMRELSRRNPQLRLVIEFFPQNLQVAKVSPEELFQALRVLGFTRIAVISRSLVPVETPQDIFDRIPKASRFYVNLLCQK